MRFDVSLKKTVGDFLLDTEFSLSGRRIGIFGSSGSGKSTLMNLLAGLNEAESGHIRLDNDLIYDSSLKVNLKPEQRRIGVVFQNAHLFPHMNVRQNVLFGWKRTKLENRRIDPDTLVRVLDIGSLLNRNVSALSGGERQRVALARTVLTCPRLILMDEPLNGLDENLKFQIIPYLKKVLSEYSIPLLFVSHSLLEMRLMTEEVLVIEQGRITRQVPTELLATSSWDNGRQGYVNLLQLGPSIPYNDLYAYKWGDKNLILTEPGTPEGNLYELDARKILLFKCHPQATSARNLLTCKVRKIYISGNRARVELICGKERLVSQIVLESVKELELEEGSELIAAIKASSFKKVM